VSEEQESEMSLIKSASLLVSLLGLWSPSAGESHLRSHSRGVPLSEACIRPGNAFSVWRLVVSILKILPQKLISCQVSAAAHLSLRCLSAFPYVGVGYKAGCGLPLSGGTNNI